MKYDDKDKLLGISISSTKLDNNVCYGDVTWFIKLTYGDYEKWWEQYEPVMDVGHIKLKFSKELFDLVVGSDKEKTEISFGEYPQHLADSGVAEETLPNGQCYHFKKAKADRSGGHYLENRRADVYEYNGQKYMHSVPGMFGDWYMVEPLRWKVDRDNCTLESKVSFCGGDSMGMLGDHTKEWLEHTVMKNILGSVKMRKIINYHNFEELYNLIENDGIVSLLGKEKRLVSKSSVHEAFLNAVEIVLDGPMLTDKQVKTIKKYLSHKIGKYSKIEFIDSSKNYDANRALSEINDTVSHKKR